MGYAETSATYTRSKNAKGQFVGTTYPYVGSASFLVGVGGDVRVAEHLHARVGMDFVGDMTQDWTRYGRVIIGLSYHFGSPGF